MKVVPNSSAAGSLPSDAASSAPSARDRAIAALIGNQTPAAEALQKPAEELAAQSQVANTPAEKEEQEPTIETPTTADPDPRATKLDSQYAILARKEKQLRIKAQQERQALADREAALAAKEAELATRDKSYQSDYISKSRLKSEALQVLTEEGISYDELTQQILNSGKSDPATVAMLRKLEAATNELREQQEAFKKDQAASQQNQYQEALQQLEVDTKRLVKSDPNFEMISLTPGAVKEVVKLIEKTYSEDKILLTVEEASELVENELVKRSMKIARAKKLQKLQSAAQPKAPAQTQTPAKQAAPAVKTLTNQASSTRQLSARERAIAVFKGELK